MSFAVHKEIIKNSHINYVLSGKFATANKFKPDKCLLHQILLVKNCLFEVYDIYKEEDVNYKYNFSCEYKLFGKITAVEKIKISNKTIDAVILVIDYAKIAIVEYDADNYDFKILCLYNLENENLSNGKKFYKENLQVIASITYNSIFILSNEVAITVLNKKSADQMNIDEPSNMNEEEIKYLDTISGEKYFDPSFYVNFRDFGVAKIIKFYIFNKENELLDYFNQTQAVDDKEKICMLLLYKESGFTSSVQESSSNIVSNPNFYKCKINLALCYISRTEKTVELFEVLMENLDQNSFDLFCLSSSPSKITVVLAPYCIQIVNLDQKICYNVILNQIYVGVFHREYTLNNINNIRGDITYVNLNLDLRGGGYIAISNTQWIFTTSKGLMYVFSFINNFTGFKVDQIHTQLRNEVVTLEAPYKFVLMPYPGVFFLSSYFADSVFVIYDGTNYVLGSKMINLSPLVNFTAVLDRFQTKFIFTSGYNKSGQINFMYDKLFYDINFATQEYQEISYLKSINFEDEIYSRYLLIAFKNGKGLIYEIGKILENITEKVSLNHKSRILNSIVIKIPNKSDDGEENTLQFVLIVYEDLIQVFNPFMKPLVEISLKNLLDSIPNSEVEHNVIEDKIRQSKLSQNALVINTHCDRFVLLYFTKENQNEISIKHFDVLDNIIVQYKEITSQLMISDKKILKYDINSKLIDLKNYLLVYRENSIIEIFDLYDFLTEATVQIQPIFDNSLISELPVMLSDNPKDFEKSLSDLTNNLILNNNTPQVNNLTTPEEIFFDLLDTKIVFSIVFKNGTIVFYEVYFVEKENKSQIKMKKFYIDFIENIDYREFFYSEGSNLYIRFDNINEKPGVILNIKGNQKVLFEINGLLKFIDFENNARLKRSFSAFSDLSREGSLNGFIYYENGYFTIANLPKNYDITEYGVLKMCPLTHFPVNLNYLTIQQGNMMVYYYITIERELKLTSIKTPSGLITVNKFNYFLNLRNDEAKVIDQVEFPAGEVIVESKIVELLNLHKIKTKYIALGINILDEKGEESACKAKLQLYNIENGKFLLVLESELRGVISMIQSIDGILIIAEGSKIYLYQYVPLTNEMKKLSVIDNKNLVTCSKIQSKFIITGDILESATWIVFKQDQDINNTSLYILGKDQRDYHSLAIDFWIDDSEETFKTGCILADDQTNLHIFIINLESNTPNRLVEVADMNIGKRITELKYYSYNNKSFVYYSSDDGSIGTVKPISKLTYERLSLLCEFLYNHLPFRAGLNPKMQFSTYLKHSSYKKEKGNIIDMEILNYYLSLPITTQKIIAKNVVLSRETLISNINEVTN